MLYYHVQKPPIIMDFEASGFSDQSYPIEVGYFENSAHLYCSLIKPLDHWAHWSQEAEHVHGLQRELLLKRGRPVRIVAQELNARLSGRTVFSDGWAVDSSWCRKLFNEARISPTFHLSPIEMIMTEGMIDIWDATKANVIEELKLQRHRASSDARIIQATWIRAYAQCHGVSESA